MAQCPAVFIDRDDTILDTTRVTATDHVPGDLYNPARAVLLAGAAGAIRSLAEAGFAVVVYSSQGGVARGSGSLRDCEAVNDAMRSLIERESGAPGLIAGVYVCPFHPKGSVPPFNREHPWRKPLPGMLTAAAAELGLDLSRSWAVGDKRRDMEAAIAAGIDASRSLLIAESSEPGARFADLAAAARHIRG